MDKLKLVYGELEMDTQEALKDLIISYWPDKTISRERKEEAVKELFSINNSRIELDVFPYMTYR